MEIQENSVVVLKYKVFDGGGELLDDSTQAEPLSYIQGMGQVIPGLEAALEGQEAGFSESFTIPAALAYGEYEDSFVQKVDLTLFEGAEIELGMAFRAQTDDGERTVIVVEMDDKSVTVDANHPLAGQDLTFDVEVLSVRDATADEIAHGHVHGEHGCTH